MYFPHIVFSAARGVLDDWQYSATHLGRTIEQHSPTRSQLCWQHPEERRILSRELRASQTTGDFGRASLRASARRNSSPEEQ
ncbi:hypothetical protein SCP_0702970 [Sparassis crispa]|uniref:Uncharacterized protein n=1 Tax=Sparassis crispa TaxID=139825 RepID=A0A401GS95_9APHY|nr:hypothetical protein SCP_0702970 [Sparassis crispa]GBE85111.1 hypothetical protein SCP_0702970 [Sparassis crispa]